MYSSIRNKMLLCNIIGIKEKCNHDFIKVIIFVIYYKGGKKIGYEY